MIGWIGDTVVDLNENPTSLPNFDYTHNSLRVSQSLFGERVKIKEETKDFFLVEALEQPRYRPTSGWHPYPGWVAKKAVLPAMNDLPCNLTVSHTHVPLILKNR